MCEIIIEDIIKHIEEIVFFLIGTYINEGEIYLYFYSYMEYQIKIKIKQPKFQYLLQ